MTDTAPIDDAPDRSALTAKQRAFLAAYPTAATVTAAAKAAGVGRRTVYDWREQPAFAAAFDDAAEEAADNLETEAHRRAVTGVRSYKFLKDGTPILHPVTGEPYYEHAYSDRLLETLLKAANPEKYRERTDSRVTGALDQHHTGTGGVRVYLPANGRESPETVKAMAAEMRDDPDYLEFLRSRAMAEGAAAIPGTPADDERGDDR